MKSAKWFYPLLFFALGVVPALAAEGEEAQDAAAPAPEEKTVDEDWLNTVWTQVDDMVKQEEFKLQETVTVAGVRGAEAEDNILDKLYYKGGKRYPSQDKLHKAIETLQKSIEKDSKSENAAKQKFFIAQCYEKLGQTKEARAYYTQVTRDHPKSPYADKAQNRLSQMAATQ